MRLWLSGLICACSLYAQAYGPKLKGFTESCFRNPALPYCATRDFAPKPAPKNGSGYGTASNAPQTSIDLAGIDWRFADPGADFLAVVDCRQLSASLPARALISQLGSKQGLTAAQTEDVLRALSGMGQVALSMRQDAVLMMVNGRPPDAVLPALEASWKSLPLAADTVLIGPASAVDQAAKRLSLETPLTDFALAALQRPVEAGFWMAASATLAGPEAVTAGAKRFELATTLADRLSNLTVFHFDAAPDSASIRPWLNTLGGVNLQGNIVHARAFIEPADVQQDFAHIAASPLGLGFAAIIRSARYLPVRDTAATVHAKPVIYGLDGGPREMK
jgi:hypothetical protein